MKTPRSLPSSSAFTLIELLVVISIIAILAGLTFSGIGTAMLAAKRVQARNDMSQIALGVTSYYTEYGKYPVVTGTIDSVAVYGAGTQGNHQIIDVLRCTTAWAATDSTSSPPQNPRQIQFLQPKVLTSGVTATTATKGCVNGSSGNWYDPWGTQYIIFMDADYAGDIDPSLIFSDFTSTNKPSFGVGVASVGYYYTKNKLTQPDAFTQPRASDKTTDLLSWQ